MQSADAGPAREEAAPLSLSVLGPPVARWGERVVAFRSRKELALLVYLALTRLPQPREHLASLFWPEQDEAAARSALRTTLSRLREHLTAAAGPSLSVLPLLQSERSVLGRELVTLAPAGSALLALDVDRLAALAGPAGEAAAEDGLEGRLAAAVAAYRGPFLAGLHFADAPELEAWVEAQRAYWQRQLEAVLGRLVGLQLGRHALSEATATAQRWLALDGLSEPAYRALMLALAGAGDRAGALAAYEAGRRVLREQLAVDPAPETAALAERLRRLPAAPSPPAGAPSAAGPVPPPLTLPFVGREREFAALVGAYQAARAGQLQVVVLAGEAGSGKSRLVDEFVRWAGLDGADVLRSRGEAARGAVPYQLLVDTVRPRLAREHAPEDLVADVWLTELVRLFPELRERYPDLPLPATLAGDEAGGPARLFEAVHQLIQALAERAAPGALVICCDDVQWSDLDVRDLVLYSMRRHVEAGIPLLLLLTVRTEALAGALELEEWLSRLARQAPTTRLTLGPLTEAETAQALAGLLTTPAAAVGEDGLPLESWLYAQCEGQPFYLVELLRALVDQGVLVPGEQAGESRGAGPRLALAPGVNQLPHLVPATVHALIREQLRGLSEAAFGVLAAAAVLGTDATFEPLCVLAALDERAGLAALDELRRRDLLVETAGDQEETSGPVVWRFAYESVREVVYTEAGEARRRLFHRRAFATLEGGGAPAATLAYHAQAAGLTEPALHALVAAGDAALTVSATRDAHAYYEQARRLLAGPGAAQPPRRQDWGEAPTVPDLHGRVEELAMLAGWLRDERCRVVQVLAAGGAGKTALAAKLAHDLAGEFEVVYWRSLRNAPPPEEWLAGAIAAIAVGQVAAPAGPEAQIQLLIGLLRTRRALLVLDNFETVLQPGTSTVRYRAEYVGYAEVLRHLATGVHQGRMLLTSREQPLRAEESAVRALHLAGLQVTDVRALLDRQALAGDETTWRMLVARYAGNPLALQVVGETVEAVFGGDIAAFLAEEATVFGSIRELLDEQTARLSSLERTVLTWLAVEREPVGFADLVADLGPGVARAAMVEAVEALRRRSLLEAGGRGAFTLQPVVLEYATARLVEALVQEVQTGQPALLDRYALVKAAAKDYVRRSQERLLARPLLERLSIDRGSEPVVEQRLLDLLGAWRGRPPDEQGYGPSNVLNLLRLLRGDLRRLDFSRLALRQAYLAEVEAQDTSLAGAHLAGAMLAGAFADPMSIALNADGSLLAAGTSAGEVCLWRVADRTPLLAVQGHGGPIFGVALSGDGRLVASGSFDGTVKLWEAPSGRLLATLRGHTGEVFGVALSGDGQLVASGSFDGTVKLWETPSGCLLATLRGHNSPILGVALSRDGRFVASGSFDGTVQLWDAPSERLLVTSQERGVPTQSVVLSEDGGLLASGSFDGTIRLWEVPSGRLLEAVQGHSSQIWCLALSGDGGLLASAGFDATIRLWEVPNGRLLATLQGHSGGIWGLALSRDGRQLASGGVDGTARLWEAPSGRLLATLQGHNSGVYSLALSGDGRLLASGGVDGMVRLWEAPAGRLLATQQGSRGPILGITLSEDGRLVASGGLDGTIRLWETTSGRLLATLRGHHGGVWSVALSRDGRLLASGSTDRTVRLWEIPSGQLLATLQGHNTAILSVALSGDGQLLASGSVDGTGRLCEVPSGRLLATLQGHAGGVWGVALSAVGGLAASGSFDGTARLWEASTGRLLATLQGHTGPIRGLALSEDGGLLASGGTDGTVRVWEAPSGRLLATLQGHTGGVWGVALSKDGRLLASGSLDGTIRLWDTQRSPGSDACLRTLQEDRRYERMDITSLTGVTEAQRAALVALGAVERGA